MYVSICGFVFGFGCGFFFLKGQQNPISHFLWITYVLGKYFYCFSIITVRNSIARTVLDLEQKYGC